MAVNKVIKSDGTTLIDITGTTATASDVASGKVFFASDGTQTTGTASSGGSSGYTRTVIAEEQTVTPVSTSLNGSTYYGATLNISEGFEASAEYIITLNDIEYFFTCQVLWGTNYLLGDINYFYGGSGLPYPFGIIWTSGTTCTLARDNGNQVTVKIEKLKLSGSGGATLITKTITANGTYNASDDSADGYSSVTVNVPTPSGSLSISENGTYDVTNYASASVNVSGGSGSSSWTKIAETSYQVSTTSTSAATVDTWATGHSELWTSDKIMYVRIRDTAGKRDGYFYGTDNFIINASPFSSASSTNQFGRWTIRYPSSEYSAGSSHGTTGYGVYVDYLYSDGRLRVCSRYSSTSSLTINGTYSVEVYLLTPPATLFG